MKIQNRWFIILSLWSFISFVSCQTKKDQSSETKTDSAPTEESATSSEDASSDSNASSQAQETSPEAQSSSQGTASQGGAADSSGGSSYMPDGVPDLGVSGTYTAVSSTSGKKETRAVAIVYSHENAANTPPDQLPAPEHSVPCEVHYYKGGQWSKVAWARFSRDYCANVAGRILWRLSKGGWSVSGPIPTVRPSKPASAPAPDSAPQPTESQPAASESEDAPADVSQ